MALTIKKTIITLQDNSDIQANGFKMAINRSALKITSRLSTTTDKNVVHLNVDQKESLKAYRMLILGCSFSFASYNIKTIF